MVRGGSEFVLKANPFSFLSHGLHQQSSFSFFSCPKHHSIAPSIYLHRNDFLHELRSDWADKMAGGEHAAPPEHEGWLSFSH
jgi:hypothetical protein